MSNEFSPAFIAELDEEAEASAEGVTRYSSDSEIELAYAELSFRVIYQSNNFFLPQLRDIIKEREVINVRPEYQRRLRWNNKKSLC